MASAICTQRRAGADVADPNMTTKTIADADLKWARGHPREAGHLYTATGNAFMQTTDRENRMEEAIRAGCTAADIHLRCSYPECSCKNLPKAITAAVAVVLRPYVREN